MKFNYWPLLIAAAFVLAIVLFFKNCKTSPNDHLDKALQHLDSAQWRLDTALARIDSARNRLDSMRKDFETFSNQLTSMRTAVDEVNLRSKNNEKMFRSSMTELKNRNQKIIEQLKVKKDTLPEIKIY